MTSITLGKVNITGDSATASVKWGSLAGSDLSLLPKKIKFRQIEKRWFCDIDPR